MKKTMLSSLAAAFGKFGVELPDHSEEDIPAMLAANASFENQMDTNTSSTAEATSSNVVQQAALKEFEQAFPYGYQIMNTSAEGLLCGWHSVILSMSAQYPELPCPTREELQDIFHCQKDDFAEAFDMSNDNNFSIDQVALVLYTWGLSHGFNLRIGYQVGISGR